MKIISGGQTGADQGGLQGASQAGVATGGICPLGFITEDGSKKWLLLSFGLIESTETNYSSRTEANVLTSDGTVIIGSIFSPGSKMTLTLCKRHRKPYLLIPFHKTIPNTDIHISSLTRFILLNNIKTLNVAGNRESKNPGIQDFTKQLIYKTLTQLLPKD